MQIRNIGNSKFVVDKKVDASGKVTEILNIMPGEEKDVESKKAEKLLKNYPKSFAPATVSVAVKAADKAPVVEKKPAE